MSRSSSLHRGVFLDLLHISATNLPICSVLMMTFKRALEREDRAPELPNRKALLLIIATHRPLTDDSTVPAPPTPVNLYDMTVD